MRSRAILWIVLVGAGVILGVVSASPSGLIVLAGLIGAMVVAYVLSTSLGHYLGLLAGWLPFVGRYVILGAGGLPDLTVERAALSLAIVLCVERSARERRAGARLGRRFRATAIALALSLPFLVQAALRASDVTNSLRVLIDAYALPAAVFLAAASVRWREDEINGFMRYALLGVAGWLAVATFEVATGQSVFSGIDYAELGRDYIRAAGPLLNPAALGWAASVFAVVGIAWLLGHRDTRRGVLGIAASLGATALSLTRSAWLGAATGFLYVVARLGGRSRWRVVVMSVLGAAAVGLMLWYVGASAVTERAGNEGTIFNRLILLATAFKLLSGSPYTGIGLSSFSEASQQALTSFGDLPAFYGANVLAPHNTVVLVAVEAGVFAAALLVYAAYQILAAALESDRRASTRTRWAASALVGGLMSTAINGVAMDLQLHWRACYVIALVFGILYGYMVTTDKPEDAS